MKPRQKRASLYQLTILLPTALHYTICTKCAIFVKKYTHWTRHESKVMTRYLQRIQACYLRHLRMTWAKWKHLLWVLWYLQCLCIASATAFGVSSQQPHCTNLIPKKFSVLNHNTTPTIFSCLPTIFLHHGLPISSAPKQAIS